MKMNIFSMDSVFYRFINKVGELLILNLLFLLCCIPIVTIGASATALYVVLFKLVRKESGYIVKDFFKAFACNFKKSTIIWILTLIVGTVLYFDIIFSDAIGGGFAWGFKVIFLFFGIIYLSLASFIFPLQSRFENSIWNTIKNAFWMAVGYLPFTISILVIELFPLFLIYVKPVLFWYMLPIMVSFGFAFIFWVCSGILNHIFERYMPEAG